MYLRQAKLIDLWVILAGFFATMDIVWSMAASGFFKSKLGDAYILLQGQTILLTGILIVVMTSNFREKRGFLFICWMFLSIGLYEWITACFLGTGKYGFQQFLFGFFFPVMLMLFVSGTQRQQLFFRFYYIGYLAYILLALMVLLVFDKTLRNIGGYGISGIVILLKSHYEDSLFFLILGNANKQSNYLILSILLGPYLLDLKNEGAQRRLYCVFAFFAVILLFLLGSRATLLLLPFVLYLNKAYFFPQSKLFKVSVYLFLLFFFCMFLSELENIFRYILFSTKIDDDSKDILGTFNGRFVQWSNLLSILREPGVLIHGVGVGNYGLMEGGVPELGTHNLFLDHMVSSGLYGPFVLSVILGIGIMKSFHLRSKRLVLAYFVFIGLAFREYSFSFLYVTSMGGLMFLFILYLTFNGYAQISTGKCVK